MAQISMTFGKVEALLSTYFRIDPDRAGTFRARLKQLQRLNFPQGVNVGRGTRFEYETEHVIKLTFAFELLAVGLPAKLATEIVEKGWERIAVALQLAVGYWFTKDDIEDVYCIFVPDLLIDSSNLSEAVLVYEKEDFEAAASKDDFTPAAILSINVTKLMRRLYVHFDHIRTGKRIVEANIRSWETKLPTLYDEFIFTNWIKVSLSRIEQFKPDPEIDDVPF